ncbi:hypothetical protein [Pseudooceanicola sp.]|uniref:hypothetical protein n=1 Tax=Pseudooceanicola sp. TaxID=1914328 RepID=UPI0035167CB6
MRLNLSPGSERYVLVPATDETVAVAIVARPALTDVIQEAVADDELLAFSGEMADLVALSEDGGALTTETLRANQRFAVALGKAIARIVIESWEGIEDPDGSPAPVKSDRINALLDHPAIWKEYEAKYLQRWLQVQQEKNVSAPSPIGTSEGAKPTAGRARKSAKSARGGSSARKA